MKSVSASLVPKRTAIFSHIIVHESKIYISYTQTCMFAEKKDSNRAPLAEMDKDETDVLHHQGAIGGINLSFSPRKSSETDKEEGMVKF